MKIKSIIQIKWLNFKTFYFNFLKNRMLCNYYFLLNSYFIHKDEQIIKLISDKFQGNEIQSNQGYVNKYIFKKKKDLCFVLLVLVPIILFGSANFISSHQASIIVMLVGITGMSLAIPALDRTSKVDHYSSLMKKIEKIKSFFDVYEKDLLLAINQNKKRNPVKTL